ncbi:MAG: leucyl/phenylalanyl-tRNA--protein transferase [Gammaproteobacteria bacterium]|nr:leucyl/phenylalanyl-tRNA--protein transferase [Gammaproteobacteria bacterium]
MSAIRWLSANADVDAFPPPHLALDEPNGLLAAGGDLRPERLLSAYRRGIFPWYERGQPILWWCPNPRAVLFPSELRVSRSLRRVVRREIFRITADTAFERVIRACAEPRRYGPGTWLTDEMVTAYCALHELGWAHSFEAWHEGELAGGLYGVAIGRVFFGESMFTRVTDASKAAFVTAVSYLRARNFELIDCQIASAHLASLGAVDVPRTRFLKLLKQLCGESRALGPWMADFAAWAANERGAEGTRAAGPTS